ncbi:hypothetical protein RCG19_13010 [Neobacillus sp. OS1-2]|uniref:hypothetical protein n=1 Tax=Neobacillus sp. OS1-2 TaxID=3070680 RepID=UPI0027E152B6|nr:hypothetical protein [Neobacillus sp. OS1-2]WML38145.1 hypothetical protein RCG19_13010 [Neobacillus sp. OS1-2]
MSSKVVKISLSIIIFFLLMMYIIWGPEAGKKQLELDSTKNEVINEVQQTKEYVNKTSDWLESEGRNPEIAYFNPPEDSSKNKDPKTDVLKYFIAGLLTNDIDIFLSSFYPETISKDLFQSNITDKVKVAEGIMERISRNGQITDVQYVVKKGAFNTETNKISVILIFKDEKKAKVTLDIIPVKDSHEKDEKSVYVINTSAWKIIEQIENSTN